MIDLDDLDRLAAAATPGPWEAQRTEDRDPNAAVYGPDGDSFAYLSWNPGNDYDMPATAALIVALVNAAPSLIAELRAARKVVAAARAWETYYGEVDGEPGGERYMTQLDHGHDEYEERINVMVALRAALLEVPE